MDAEQKWLDALRPYERSIGFNLSVSAGLVRGCERSPESKAAMAEKMRQAFKEDPERLERFKEGRRNRVLTDDARRRIGEASRNRKSSREAIEKRRQAALVEWQVTKPNQAPIIFKESVAWLCEHLSISNFQFRFALTHRGGVLRDGTNIKRLSEKRLPPIKPQEPRWRVFSPNGDFQDVVSLSAFCREHNIAVSNLAATSKGRKRSAGGFYCVDLFAKEQRERKTHPGWLLTSPTGETYTLENLKAFCVGRGLIHTALGQVALGKRHHHKGWTAERIIIP